MAIDSKNLLTVIKAYARAEKLPLDQSEVWESLSAAQSYLTNPTAYEGQTIKAKVDGKYKTYTLQPSGSGGTLELEEVGALKTSDLKQYEKVVNALPQEGQEQGVLYINTTDSTGSIYNGSTYQTVFENVTTKVNEVAEDVKDGIEGRIDGVKNIINKDKK